MPRKKPAAPAAAPVEVPAVSIPLDHQPSAWSDLLGEMTADADVQISVFAEPEKGQGGAAFLFKVSASDFPDLSDLLTYIRQHADGGPGVYSLRPKRGTQFIGATRVRIGGRAPPAATIAPAPLPVPNPTPPAESEFTKFLQTLVVTLLGRPAPEASKGAGMSDVIEAAKLLTEGRRERNPISELKELLEVRDLIGGGGREENAGDGESWVTAAIRTFGPPLVNHAMTPPPAPVTMQAFGTPKPAAIAAPAAPPPPRPAMPPELRAMLNQLLRGARNESDPDVYAVILLDTFEGDDAAAAMLGRPDAIDMLCMLEPAAVPFRAWFGAVLTAARELLAEEPAGDLTAPQAPADGAAHVDGQPGPVS